MRGFTLIELLVVLIVIGLLAGIAIPRLGTARERAHMGTITQDFRNLGHAQERYHQVNLTYGGTEDVNFQASPGVEVEVTEATATGWAAVGTHTSLTPDRGCVFYLGNAVPPPLPNGEAHSAGSGAVQCTN